MIMGQVWKNKQRPITQIGNNNILNKNETSVEFYKILLSWDGFYSSPFSQTIYSKKKSWGYTQPGTLRLSDHWNFVSRDKIHCVTKTEVMCDTHVSLGRFDEDDGKYEIILSIEKPNSNKNRVDVNAYLTDWFKNSEYTQKSIEKGRELKTRILEKQIYAEVQLFLEGGSLLVEKGLVEKYFKSKLFLIREDGSEFKISNKKFNRCIVKLFDKEGGRINLEFDKHKKN